MISQKRRVISHQKKALHLPGLTASVHLKSLNKHTNTSADIRCFIRVNFVIGAEKLHFSQ